MQHVMCVIEIDSLGRLISVNSNRYKLSEESLKAQKHENVFHPLYKKKDENRMHPYSSSLEFFA